MDIFFLLIARKLRQAGNSKTVHSIICINEGFLNHVVVIVVRNELENTVHQNILMWSVLL